MHLGYHTKEQLRACLGQGVLAVFHGPTPHRFRAHRGALGTLEKVHRVNGVVRFEDQALWRIPLDLLVLSSHPRFAVLRDAELMRRQRDEKAATGRRAKRRRGVFRRSKPSRPRDSQRKKIYDWEATLSTGENLSLGECQQLVQRLARAYGVEPPRIGDGRGRRSAAYTSTHEIRLPVRFRNQRTVLHEMAHALAQVSVGDREPAHGPTFVCVYLELLQHHMGLSSGGLEESAQQAGIRFRSD